MKYDVSQRIHALMGSCQKGVIIYHIVYSYLTKGFADNSVKSLIEKNIVWNKYPTSYGVKNLFITAAEYKLLVFLNASKTWNTQHDQIQLADHVFAFFQDLKALLETYCDGHPIDFKKVMAILSAPGILFPLEVLYRNPLHLQMYSVNDMESSGVNRWKIYKRVTLLKSFHDPLCWDDQTDWRPNSVLEKTFSMYDVSQHDNPWSLLDFCVKDNFYLYYITDLGEMVMRLADYHIMKEKVDLIAQDLLSAAHQEVLSSNQENTSLDVGNSEKAQETDFTQLSYQVLAYMMDKEIDAIAIGNLNTIAHDLEIPLNILLQVLESLSLQGIVFNREVSYTFPWYLKYFVQKEDQDMYDSITHIYEMMQDLDVYIILKELTSQSHVDHLSGDLYMTPFVMLDYSKNVDVVAKLYQLTVFQIIHLVYESIDGKQWVKILFTYNGWKLFVQYDRMM